MRAEFVVVEGGLSIVDVEDAGDEDGVLTGHFDQGEEDGEIPSGGEELAIVEEVLFVDFFEEAGVEGAEVGEKPIGIFGKEADIAQVSMLEVCFKEGLSTDTDLIFWVGHVLTISEPNVWIVVIPIELF